MAWNDPTTYILSQYPDTGIVLLRKNGSSSLKEVIRRLGGHGPLITSNDNPKLGELRHVIAIVREPQARLTSAWQYWVKQLHTLETYPRRGFPNVSQNLEDYLLETLNTFEDQLDQHFRPQQYLLPKQVTHLIKLEEIGTAWPRLQQELRHMPIPDFPHHGKSKPRPDNHLTPGFQHYVNNKLELERKLLGYDL